MVIAGTLSMFIFYVVYALFLCHALLYAFYALYTMFVCYATFYLSDAVPCLNQIHIVTQDVLL